MNIKRRVEALERKRAVAAINGHPPIEYFDHLLAGTVTAAERTKWAPLTLEAVEFIRRFLLHVFPSGFVHIRHFGFLANRRRKAKLALCRSLLPAQQTVVETNTDSPGNRDSTAAEPVARLCPVCKAGRLMFVQVLSAEVLARLPTPMVADTS